MLVPSVLLTSLKAGKGPLQLEGGWDSVIIGLFAAGSGVQVVMVSITNISSNFHLTRRLI